MSRKKVLFVGLVCGAVLLFFIGRPYFLRRHTTVPDLYATIQPEKRVIRSVVKASGTIQVKNMIKIGSLVLGRVDKLLVEENERVKKGQLLAIIDDGRGDKDVKEAQANLAKARTELGYASRHYDRNVPMHEKGFISDDAFDLINKNVQSAQSSVDALVAVYERTKMLYEAKFIKSPANGIVISKNISEGETATLTSPATIIYTIAEDLSHMEVKLEVDENIIASLEVNETALLVFAAYPDSVYEAQIRDISRAPHDINNAVHYYVTLNFENRGDRFKPGMTVDAELTIAFKENALAIPSHVFMLPRESIVAIGKQKGMAVNELTEEQYEKLKKQEHTKVVWIVRKGAFHQIPITVGLHDRSYYEIISGLQTGDAIVSDVPEADAVQEFFKKMFGKGL